MHASHQLIDSSNMLQVRCQNGSFRGDAKSYASSIKRHPQAAMLNPMTVDAVSKGLYCGDGDAQTGLFLRYDEREHDFRRRKGEQ